MKKIFMILGGLLMGMSACEDMLDTGSERYLMTEDNSLGSANDAMYSVLGVLHQMRALGERYVLLGELRGDLVDYTANAEADLQNIANFEVKPGDGNALATTRPYYQVINNCNYFLARADTTVLAQGNRVLLQEYAVMLTFRTWTYLQLALNFKEVTYITEPILTLADVDKNYPTYDMTQKGQLQVFAKRLIADLLPYVNIPMPDYGSIGTTQGFLLLIPAPLLLADLSLWAAESEADFKEAATRYYNYLTAISSNEVQPYLAGGNNYALWTNDSRDNIFQINGGYMGTFTMVPVREVLTQMVFSLNYDGLKLIYYAWPADAERPFEYKIAPSPAAMSVFENEPYFLSVKNADGSETKAYLPGGDMRGATHNNSFGGYNVLGSVITTPTLNADSVSIILKYSGGNRLTSLDNKPIALFRAQITWLHYAEALNWAGYPTLAFAVLKYGLNHATLTDPNRVNPAEVNPLPPFADFMAPHFDPFQQFDNELLDDGVHRRGSGFAAKDTLYAISQAALDFNNGQGYPGFPAQLTTDDDKKMFVDAMLFKELTLESAFEGNRFSDLIRFADRRSDPTFLAKWVSRKKPALESKLQTRGNWFLPAD